jgi:hypothetical protein
MNVDAVVRKDGKVDLIVKQGATWDFTILLLDESGDPEDLTEYTSGRGQVRRNYDSTEVVGTFTVTVGTPPTEGKVKVVMSADDTANIPAGNSYKHPDSKYVYDIELETASGYVLRALDGNLYVDPEVTR